MLHSQSSSPSHQTPNPGMALALLQREHQKRSLLSKFHLPDTNSSQTLKTQDGQTVLTLQRVLHCQGGTAHREGALRPRDENQKVFSQCTQGMVASLVPRAQPWAVPALCQAPQGTGAPQGLAHSSAAPGAAGNPVLVPLQPPGMISSSSAQGPSTWAQSSLCHPVSITLLASQMRL